MRDRWMQDSPFGPLASCCDTLRRFRVDVFVVWVVWVTRNEINCVRLLHSFGAEHPHFVSELARCNLSLTSWTIHDVEFWVCETRKLWQQNQHGLLSCEFFLFVFRPKTKRPRSCVRNYYELFSPLQCIVEGCGRMLKVYVGWS